MANDLVFEIKAEDDATGTLDKVQREIRETGNAASSAGGGFSAAGKQSAGLGASLLKTAKSGLAIGAVVGIVDQVGDVLMRANELSIEYSRSSGDMAQALNNATSSQLEAMRAAEEYEQAIESMADVTGRRIPELEQVMVDLTTRTGEVAGQGENLERVLGLVNLTGRETRDVAKTLGEALTGDLGPMKELGILTQEQIEKFSRIDDSGTRVSKMLEVLDEKIDGFAEGLPEAQVQSDRLSSSWERLLAAIGDVAPTSSAIGVLADITTVAAEGAEDFAEAWTTGPKSIGEAIREATGDLKDFKREAADLGAVETSVGETRIKLFERELETQRMLIQERIDSGLMDAYMGELEILRAERAMEEKIGQLREQYGLFEDRALSKAERRRDAAMREAVLAQETNDVRRAQLEMDFKIQDIREKHTEELAELADESERELVIQRQQAEVQAARAQGEEKLTEARRKAAEERRKAEEEQRAAMHERLDQLGLEVMLYANGLNKQEYERNQLLTMQLELVEMRGEAFDDEIERMERANSLAMERYQITKELAEEEEEILRKGKVDDIEDAASFATGVGDGLGDAAGILSGVNEETERELAELEAMFDERIQNAATDAAKAELEAKKEAALGQARSEAQMFNDELIMQLELWGQIGGAIGKVTDSVAELVDEQWDFEKASDAAIAAIGAAAEVGTMAASAFAKNKKQEAGIAAGFHYAAAAGALGLGLVTGSTNYFLAAAQHGISAAMYTAVATGAGKGGGSSSGGGGGGGGGGSTPSSNVDVAAEREKTAQAFAAAIAEQNQAQGYVINVDLGSGNVIPTESERFADIVGQGVRRAQLNVTGLNTELD